MNTMCTQKQTEKQTKVTAFELKNMDTTIAPGADFFRYVNGNWMKNNPIPADESRWSAFNVLNEENQSKLKVLMEEAQQGKHDGTTWKQIGNFYASGLDTNNINKMGYEPIKPLLSKIDAIKDKNDFVNLSSELNSYGIGTLFNFWVGADDKNSTMNIFNFYQGGLSLPSRDYYLENNERMNKIRNEYVIHLTNMFKLIGTNPDEAKKIADNILKMETEIAQISRTNVALRDPASNYNNLEIKSFQTTFSNYDLNTFFKNIGIQEPASANVGQPEFFAGLNKIINKYTVDDLKNYLKWKLMTESASYLSSDFDNENFNFFGKILYGIPQMKERWKRVLNTTNSSLGEAVGKIYVEKYFPKEAKDKMDKLVENLRVGLKKRIEKVSWMSEETRKKALDKLAKIGVKIGYPNKWKNYDKIEVSKDNYWQNVFNASKFLTADNLNKIGKPVDKEEWHMTPQTVNAYYSPNGNEIVFPAAILQPPFFNVDADDAINYGAIGVVIGHEMTHGFDDQGRNFDAIGNMTDWWTKDDAEKFNEKAKVLVNQFNGYKAIKDETINGELTLGENIADFGGLTVALEALKIQTKDNLKTPKIDNFTPLQRFFLSYAQIWRQNIRDEELMSRLKDDVHSPGEFRVNGGVVNIPEFYEAFNIKSSDKLYVAPESRANIW